PEGVQLVRDEMGSSRWPRRVGDWLLAGPDVAADRRLHQAGPTHRPRCRIGALNGHVNSRDPSQVGREQVSTYSRPRVQVDAAARCISCEQDTWSIHDHAAVLAPRRQAPVWLPTDAPWLTPIE